MNTEKRTDARGPATDGGSAGAVSSWGGAQALHRLAQPGYLLLQAL